MAPTVHIEAERERRIFSSIFEEQKHPLGEAGEAAHRITLAQKCLLKGSLRSPLR